MAPVAAAACGYLPPLKSSLCARSAALVYHARRIPASLVSALLFASTQEVSPLLHSTLVSARFAAPAVSRFRLFFYQAVGNATTPPTGSSLSPCGGGTGLLIHIHSCHQTAVTQMPPWRDEGLLGGNGPIALPVCLNILIKSEPKGNGAVSPQRSVPLLLNHQTPAWLVVSRRQ